VASTDGGETTGAKRFYQLTHDYLVPSIRKWLTRKQGETLPGRAELRLAERAALWNAKPENRHLPSVPEWATIRVLTKTRNWTEPQRRMIRRAERVYGLRALGLVVMAFVTWGGIEVYGRHRASELVDSLKTANTTDVPAIIRQLSGYRRWANPRLVRLLTASQKTPRVQLHARLALLPVDASQVGFLSYPLLNEAPSVLRVFRDALKPHKTTLIPKLWPVLASAWPGHPQLLPAAGALAHYDPENPRWADFGDKVAQELMTVNPVYLGNWLEALHPWPTARTTHGLAGA